VSFTTHSAAARARAARDDVVLERSGLAIEDEQPRGVALIARLLRDQLLGSA
jgi:hypothetical protein